MEKSSKRNSTKIATSNCGKWGVDTLEVINDKKRMDEDCRGPRVSHLKPDSEYSKGRVGVKNRKGKIVISVVFDVCTSSISLDEGLGKVVVFHSSLVVVLVFATAIDGLPSPPPSCCCCQSSARIFNVPAITLHSSVLDHQRPLKQPPSYYIAWKWRLICTSFVYS